MARKTKNKAEETVKQVLEHFQVLRIPVRRENLDEALRESEKSQGGHLEFLENILGAQARGRKERSIDRRIRSACFVERKTLEEFDWEFNAKAIDRVQIQELGTSDFVRRRENLIIVGQSGVGKSHLIQALGIRACVNGFNVRYTRSAALIEDLTAAFADHTLPSKLRVFTRPQLLVIDEFGFDQLERQASPEAVSLLYKIIDGRYHQHSTALVTNLDFDAWANYLGDPALSMAILDRLIENAVVLKINGKSYRAAKAKKK